MIDHKAQRYEIAQEVAFKIKECYDETESNSDYDRGYRMGLDMAYGMFRSTLMSYDDMDDDKLKSLGVAYDLWDVDVKDF